jgi:archaellum biogenesis protein FlaJ (TadC family)
MNTAVQAVVEDVVYGGIVGLVGAGTYRAFTRRATGTARRVVAALVVAAVAFIIVVVTLDAVEGTGTSTESFIIFIAVVPLLLAIALVIGIDGRVRRERAHGDS